MEGKVDRSSQPSLPCGNAQPVIGRRGGGAEGCGGWGTEEQALGIHPRGCDSVYRMASCFPLPRPNTFHPWLPLGNQARICFRKQPFVPRSASGPCAPLGGASCPGPL